MEQHAASADLGAFITFSRAPSRFAVDPCKVSDRRCLSSPRCRLWHRWGGSHRYRSVAWSSVQRLVFLCGDNTYVGPYAERRARALGLGSISFGLRATAGAGVPAAAMAAASERGVGLAGHRARLLAADAIQPGDLLIGFTPAHCAHAAALLARGERVQVALLALGTRASGPDADLVARCYERIDQALALMEREHGGRPGGDAPTGGSGRLGVFESYRS